MDIVLKSLLSKCTIRKYKNEIHILSFAPLIKSECKYILSETGNSVFVDLHDQKVIEIGGWKHMTAHLYIYK